MSHLWVEQHKYSTVQYSTHNAIYTSLLGRSKHRWFRVRVTGWGHGYCICMCVVQNNIHIHKARKRPPPTLCTPMIPGNHNPDPCPLIILLCFPTFTQDLLHTPSWPFVPLIKGFTNRRATDSSKQCYETDYLQYTSRGFALLHCVEEYEALSFLFDVHYYWVPTTDSKWFIKDLFSYQFIISIIFRAW